MTRLAIIGGGLSGLAAAAAAVEAGLEVELFEARRRLGGRAGSFVDPASGRLVDYCQHVAMGCCTQWSDFCKQTGIEGCFERYRRLWLVGPEGRTYSLCAWPLPAPFHLLPSLLRLNYLSWSERWNIVRALSASVREEHGQQSCGKHAAPGVEPSDLTIGQWLKQHRQSDRAAAWFWSPILTSALSESLDRASAAAARQVMREGFMADRHGYELYVPRHSLAEIYDQRLANWLIQRGVGVHCGARVKRLEVESGRATGLVLGDGTRAAFDFYLVAVPWNQLRRLFSPAAWSTMPELARIEAIRPAPIAALHFWFDRPITRLPHAALVGRLGQWMFAKTPGTRFRDGHATSASPNAAENDSQGHADGGEEHYCQVVISAAHDVLAIDRERVVARVQSELEAIWPSARAARLLRSRLVIERAAVFSAEPGVESRRPPQTTSISNVMLAGDWTATGWPATMESAVRSGRLAVGGILDLERMPRTRRAKAIL